MRLRLFLLFALTLPVLAQQTGLPFLEIGTSAAEMATGSAGVADISGAHASYWNPAGLAAGSNDASLTYDSWIGGVELVTVAARFGIGSGGLGLSVTSSSAGGIEARNAAGPPSGEFDATYLSVSAAYALQVGPVRAGASVKYLSEQLFLESATGVGFDAGFQADVLNDRLLVGASVQHLGEMEELGLEASALPTTIRAGVTLRPFDIITEDDFVEYGESEPKQEAVLRTTVRFDVSHQTEAERTRLHAGLEGELFDMIALRAGYITNHDTRSATFGLGFAIDAFGFDFAYLPFDAGFSSAQVLTLRYGW
ncbi:MAG: PorV/PorQ family protein [Bacteroidota bacterium]